MMSAFDSGSSFVDGCNDCSCRRSCRSYRSLPAAVDMRNVDSADMDSRSGTGDCWAPLSVVEDALNAMTEVAMTVVRNFHPHWSKADLICVNFLLISGRRTFADRSSHSLAVALT